MEVEAVKEAEDTWAAVAAGACLTRKRASFGMAVAYLTSSGAFGGDHAGNAGQVLRHADAAPAAGGIQNRAHVLEGVVAQLEDENPAGTHQLSHLADERLVEGKTLLAGEERLVR